MNHDAQLLSKFKLKAPIDFNDIKLFPRNFFYYAEHLFKIHKYDESIEVYEHINLILPDDPTAFAGLGAAMLGKENLDQAILFLEKSIAIKPEQPAALSNLSFALEKKDRLQEALEKANQALLYKPDFADAYNNKGNILLKLERLEETLECYNKALLYGPSKIHIHNPRGVVLQNLNRLEEAIASYDKSIELRPDVASAYFNKGYIKLLMGDFEMGWRLSEWRWKGFAKKLFRGYKKPLWLGDPSIKDKTILIHYEQGLGDIIQFCRYIPMVQALGAKVIVDAPKMLVNILRSLKCDIQVFASGEKLPDFDFYCPIMSLPLAFKTSLKNVPANVPYLFVDGKYQKEVSERLGNKKNPRVGIVWAGSANSKIDSGFWRRRSMPLKLLDKFFSLPLEFHAVQKEINQTDLDELKRIGKIISHQEELTDFTETAAILNEMDLVISIDTSVAHLAGALGKPVWILIPFAPDYRWMLNMDTNPWYPTAKLFRQKNPGDWDSVIDAIYSELTKKFNFAL